MVAEGDRLRPAGLLEAISAGPGQSVAAVGAGGKTSLLTALAREFHAESRKPAILTTTTKTFSPLPEEELPLVLGESDTIAKSLRIQMDACGVCWFARGRGGKVPVPGQEKDREPKTRMKLIGFAPAEISRIMLADGLTLVEADGARRLPIKAPGPDEPVLPENVDIALGVVGLDALGAPLDEAHVFRPALLAQICGLGAGEQITAESIGKLCRDPEGLFHKTGTSSRKWIVINKADLEPSMAKLKKIAYTIWGMAGKPHGPAEGILLTFCAEKGCKVLFRITPDT